MSDLIFICNECGRKHNTNTEPTECDCGMDNFGIHNKEEVEE